MQKKASVAFTASPRGYTSVCADTGATWLEKRFRAAFLEERSQLEGALKRLTKAQLEEFITAAGGHCYHFMKKPERVCLALILQLYAWYPERKLRRSTDKTCGGTLHYENLAGIRVYRTENQKKVYSYRCSKCGTLGENDGNLKRKCSASNYGKWITVSNE